MLYKFLSFPVVDAERRMIGVVDVSLLTEELLDTDDAPAAPPCPPARPRSGRTTSCSSCSASISRRCARGLAVAGVSLPVSVAAGDDCLRDGLRLCFRRRSRRPWRRASSSRCFLTMVLGLNESLSIQAMSVTIRGREPAAVMAGIPHDIAPRDGGGVLLATACGVTVAGVVLVWQRDGLAAAVIGGSIALSLRTATFFGVGVPTLFARRSGSIRRSPPAR